MSKKVFRLLISINHKNPSPYAKYLTSIEVVRSLPIEFTITARNLSDELFPGCVLKIRQISWGKAIGLGSGTSEFGEFKLPELKPGEEKVFFKAPIVFMISGIASLVISVKKESLRDIEVRLCLHSKDPGKDNVSPILYIIDRELLDMEIEIKKLLDETRKLRKNFVELAKFLSQERRGE